MTGFIIAFLLNLVVAVVIVRFIYYPSNRSKTYVFSFLSLNTVLFFVLSVLTSVELGIGVGFGLFAVFSIMRYRTNAIPIREMTYMFILAALPVLNMAGVNGQFWPQIIAANVAVVVVLTVLERGWGFRFESTKDIVYENAELAHPDRRAELITDLKRRTGLDVKRVAIGKLDFSRNTVRLRVYFENSTNGHVQNGDESSSDSGDTDD